MIRSLLYAWAPFHTHQLSFPEVDKSMRCNSITQVKHLDRSTDLLEWKNDIVAIGPRLFAS